MRVIQIMSALPALADVFMYASQIVCIVGAITANNADYMQSVRAFVHNACIPGGHYESLISILTAIYPIL